MPNKATSKSQFRFLKGIAEGSIPEHGTLTKEKAAEMLGSQTPKGLPEKVKRKTFHRVMNRISKATKGKRFRVGK